MTGTEAFRGIYPILYAFFGADGRIDDEAMRRQVRGCLNAGAHGIALLGLITEVRKLSREERLSLVALAVEEVAGTVPVAVTVAEDTVADQVAMVSEAAALGADWVILQPPRIDDLDEAALLRFFGAVADAAPLPVAIQNAPAFLGIGLGPAAIRTLNRHHPRFCLLKGEGPVLEIRRVIEETAGAVTVFNGRGGLELPDNLRAGCAGMIPAPECFDRQVAIFDLMAAGDEAGADAAYAAILPLITFLMQSVETSLCYGKRIVARRAGLGDVVNERDPAMVPTPFGLGIMDRYSADLPMFDTTARR
ncbi:MAG: dihydrodipicolinate synthase family protein [Azospirillaceae bacterium]